ncbi:MAG: MBOAT family protein [Burkholderiales bacterium]|nr:MBOAT family protein [Burkholderiales bacterium]
MLFNSHPFLFVFLPVVLSGCFILANRRARLVVPWLVGASIVFYGWWDWRHVPLLIGSIAFNYLAGERIARRGGGACIRNRWLLAAAVAANLGLLGYFKYAGFVAANATALLDLGWHFDAIVLPLGISFFTFTQIAYLVDVYRDPVHYRFIHYALFVTYFPHLIAGPILHHREMMPQFTNERRYRLDLENLAAGLSLLAIGLFKKTVLADGIAPHAAPVFDGASQGYAPGVLEAWAAALAFGLQLYFDFSAYSDMAVGLSKMFGISLPVNFESPYKATSIIEFWRRWHITLARFLRQYLYFALGGSRRATVRRYTNLLVTMLLGGLWHGAAWTFVAWGAFHGALLMINHAWRDLRARLSGGPSWLKRIEVAIGAAITFVAVFVGWVLFRADDLPSAVTILRGMAGLNGTSIPPPWLMQIAAAARWLVEQDWGLPITLRRWIFTHVATIDSQVPRGLTEAGNAGVLISKAQLLWIAGLLLIAWFAPNTRQIMAHTQAFISAAAARPTVPALMWRLDRGWAIATALLLVTGLMSMSGISEFLYFQF